MDLNFNKNEDFNKLQLSELKKRFAKVSKGGGTSRIAKQHEKGKLSVRERIQYLLDKKSDCIEIGAFAGDGMYEEHGGCPSAGVVVKIGYISGKEKSAAYHASEVLVIPSRKEAMSIVALEAGICGTAVIMTDECGFPEMVDAGAAIEVPADAGSLTDALSSSLSDRAKLKVMGCEAKKFISENYTWKMAAKDYRGLCNKVLNL